MNNEDYQPSAGRPVNMPSDAQLGKLDLLTLVFPKAKKILSDCKAPSFWGEDELRLILNFVAWPDNFDAITPRKFPSKILEAHRTENALNFGRMVAQAPNTIIDALPKIRTLIHKSKGIPQSQKKRKQNLLATVVAHYVWHHIFDSHFHLEDSNRFWIEKASTVAHEYKDFLKLPVTPRTIEDARSAINSLFPPIPKKM